LIRFNTIFDNLAVAYFFAGHHVHHSEYVILSFFKSYITGHFRVTNSLLQKHTMQCIIAVAAIYKQIIFFK